MRRIVKLFSETTSRRGLFEHAKAKRASSAAWVELRSYLSEASRQRKLFYTITIYNSTYVSSLGEAILPITALAAATYGDDK